MTHDDVELTLRQAAAVVSSEGLSDAFGHLSVRTGQYGVTMTPPVPLGLLGETDELVHLRLDAEQLPASVPREAWIHQAFASRRPEIGAICRAQPRGVAAMAATGHPIRPGHGHGAFLGNTVPIYADSRLVRDRTAAESLADVLGDAPAVVMRGNGAVTVGVDMPHAVALMWALERSAQLNLAAATAGGVEPLSSNEQEWWRARADELLPRIYAYLVRTHNETGDKTPRTPPGSTPATNRKEP